MPSTYSSNLLLELMADGEKDTLWGAITNENLEILGRAVSGVTTVSLAGTTHTLTVSQGALSEGHYAVLELGGSPTGTNTITINPNTVDRIYLVKNSSGQNAIFTQGSGGNVTVANGDTAIIYSDGAGAGAKVTELTADFMRGSNNLSDIDSAATALTNLGLTATAAELNTLDGLTATTAELNKLDGLTSSTAELNILDGVTWTLTDYNTLTSTAVELNKLDGFTGTFEDLNYAKDLRATGVTTTEFDKLDGLSATTTELNYVSGVTSSIQTQLDGKAANTTQAEATWEAGTGTTESLVSPAKVKAAIEASRTEVSEVATTSGTSVDIITSIPAGVNSIELYFYDISISAADFIVIQLGTSLSYSTSGYIGGITQGSAGVGIDKGLPAVYSITAAATDANSGVMNIHRVPGTNKWVAKSGIRLSLGTGSIDLGAQLTRLRVTTNAGTATFDNGGISARYI